MAGIREIVPVSVGLALAVLGLSLHNLGRRPVVDEIAFRVQPHCLGLEVLELEVVQRHQEAWFVL